MSDYISLLEHKVNQQFNNFLIVKSATSSTASNGKLFIKAVLADKSTEVTAMIWEADSEKEAVFTAGNIVNISGTIIEYQGSRQIKIQNYVDVTDDNIPMENLIKIAPVNPDDMYNTLINEINTMHNWAIKNITFQLLEKYKDDFKVYPAAKGVHHAYKSGLAYHTYSMVNMAKSMLNLYPELNADLLIAGTILHDIGKIKDYTGYIGTEMTLRGKLKGHISTISEEIMHVAISLGLHDDEAVLLLQHMVLSHHGKGEWGSPVTPQIIEAFVLHQMDQMDASIDAHRNAIIKTDKYEFTERIFGLDNKPYYNHGL